MFQQQLLLVARRTRRCGRTNYSWKVIANELRLEPRGRRDAGQRRTVPRWGRFSIQYNGQLGVGQYSSSNGTIKANEVSNNNTNRLWIADWESGGIKTTWWDKRGVTGNLIKQNVGVGLWSDAYDDGRVYSDNQIVDNAADKHGVQESAATA